MEKSPLKGIRKGNLELGNFWHYKYKEINFWTK